LGSFACELSFGILCLRTCAWDPSLGNFRLDCRLRMFALDLSFFTRPVKTVVVTGRGFCATGKTKLQFGCIGGPGSPGTHWHNCFLAQAKQHCGTSLVRICCQRCPHLGAFASKLSFGNVSLEILAWKLSFGSVRLGTFVSELSFGNFRLETLVWELGFRILPLGFFCLGSFAWGLSLGNFRLGPQAEGTGLLRLGEPRGTGPKCLVFRTLSKHPSK